MSKPQKQPETKPATISIAAVGPKPDVYLRLRRVDYLHVCVEEITVVDGRVTSRKTVHPKDVANIAVARAYEALDRMLDPMIPLSIALSFLGSLAFAAFLLVHKANLGATVAYASQALDKRFDSIQAELDKANSRLDGISTSVAFGGGKR